MRLTSRLRLWLLCWRLRVPVSFFDAWVEALYLEAQEVGRLPAHIAQPLTALAAVGAPRPAKRQWLREAQHMDFSEGVNLIHMIKAMEATDAVIATQRDRLTASPAAADQLMREHLRPSVEQRLLEDIL